MAPLQHNHILRQQPAISLRVKKPKHMDVLTPEELLQLLCASGFFRAKVKRRHHKGTRNMRDQDAACTLCVVHVVICDLPAVL